MSPPFWVPRMERWQGAPFTGLRLRAKLQQFCLIWHSASPICGHCGSPQESWNEGGRVCARPPMIAREADVIIAIGTSDATLHGVSNMADRSSVPVMVLHPKNLMKSGLIDGNPQWPQVNWLAYRSNRISRSSCCCSLKGEVRLFNDPQPKAQGSLNPADKMGKEERRWIPQPRNSDFFHGSQGK